MIKKYEEFISEGLWKKGFERNKTGELRIEDKIPLNTICNYIGEIVCEYLNRDYDKDMCKWRNDYTSSSKSKEYLIKINVYNIEFGVTILDKYFEDEEHVANDICDAVYSKYTQYNFETKTNKLMKHVFGSLVEKYNIEYYKKIFKL